MIDNLPSSVERREEALGYVETMFSQHQTRQTRWGTDQFRAYKPRSGNWFGSRTARLFGGAFLVGFDAGGIVGFGLTATNSQPFDSMKILGNAIFCGIVVVGVLACIWFMPSPR